jgi:hypothetical protein
MPCATIEIREGAVTRRARIAAASMERALGMGGEGRPVAACDASSRLTRRPSSSAKAPAGVRRHERGA